LTAVLAMQMHEDSEGVQRQACLALFNLNTGADAKHVVRAGKAGAVERLAAALRRHVSCEGVQERASPALYSMPCDNAVNLIRATNAGAIEVLVAVLRTHATHQGVQMNAIQLLMNMTGYNRTRGQRDRAIHAGAVEALAAAMCGCLESDDVQVVACRGLQNLTIVNVAKRIRAGNASTIEQSRLWWRRSAGTRVPKRCRLEMVCGCLSTLTSSSSNAVNKTRAWNAGAVGAVVAALRNHLGRESVQTSGSLALCNLSSGNVGNSARAGNAGAVEAVVTAMLRHGGCKRLQEVV
jgi:hypothetical protein